MKTPIRDHIAADTVALNRKTLKAAIAEVRRMQMAEMDAGAAAKSRKQRLQHIFNITAHNHEAKAALACIAGMRNGKIPAELEVAYRKALLASLDWFD